MAPQVVVALTTPFRKDRAVAEDALAQHVAFLVEEGVDAVMPCGTTGEGPLLEPDEVEAVVRATVAAAGGRTQVLAHVGRPSTAATLQLADLLRRARDGEDVQQEISVLRERLPFPRLKAAVAERVPGYPEAYRAPLP